MNVFDMPFSKVYACLVQKAERKGRTKDEVDRIITWLTGYPTVEAISNVSYGAFIDGAPEWNPRAEFITGKVCGIQVETIADPRMKKLRQLDKLVDELAKGLIQFLYRHSGEGRNADFQQIHHRGAYDHMH